MTSSPTTMLFSQLSDREQSPASFAASILVHAAAIGVFSFGFLYTPRIETHVATEHYTVRHLVLHTPDQQMRRAARGSLDQVMDRSGLRLAERALASGGHPAPRPPVFREEIHARPAPQTLVQPDLAAKLSLAEKIPIPELLIWAPRTKVVKNIVAPQPRMPTAADVTPRVEKPNQEVNLAEVNIAASPLPDQKLKILPSTTSPVAVHAPNLVQLPPETVSQVAAQPTPIAVMSLSNLRMKDGTVTLPPVNETASSSSLGALIPGVTARGSLPGKGNPAAQGGGKGPGQGAPNAPAAPAGQPSGVNAGLAQGATAGQGQDNQGSSTEITLSKDGSFGAVIVGNSLQDEFPQLADVWSGRLAYTVYLHVGLARSWILQYSLPSSAEATVAGNVPRIEAPWPYSIVRPDLAPGSIDADALMIHGFVNRAGRFETLSVVFPQQCPQAQFVLKSLARWQFRPATENGQNAKVEVLLIIPEEME